MAKNGSYLGTGGWLIPVLLLGLVSCKGESERPVATPEDEVPVPEVSATDQAAVEVSSDTNVVVPADTLLTPDTRNPRADAGELPSDPDTTEVVQVPDCAVWVGESEPPDDDALPSQPVSSRQPCHCYPDGASCTAYFWESCAWDSGPYVVEESVRCPEGEICAGDNTTGPPSKGGVCVRPCSRPDAVVNAPFACAPSEECVVARLPPPGAQLPCAIDTIEQPCRVPDGFRTCEEAWHSFDIAMCVPKERRQPFWDFSGCPPEDRPQAILPDVSP